MNVLQDHPQYRDLFIDKPVVESPEVHWLAPADGLRNSKCGLYQVRRAGDPALYSLWSIRMTPFARLIREGFASFEDVKIFLRKGERNG